MIPDFPSESLPVPRGPRPAQDGPHLVERRRLDLDRHVGLFDPGQVGPRRVRGRGDPACRGSVVVLDHHHVEQADAVRRPPPIETPHLSVTLSPGAVFRVSSTIACPPRDAAAETMALVAVAMPDMRCR